MPRISTPLCEEMRIELHDIVKYYGPVRANEGISLTVEPGIIHGLLGENGAGKTTLMKILAGYQPCDSGRIVLDGRVVCFRSPQEALSAGIGMLHQDPLDVPALSVLDNFELGRGTGFMRSSREARRQLEALCRRFEMRLDADAPVRSLTVGERQQLELIRLLSMGVRVIILDEPTTGISAPQKERLFAALRELASEGLSIVFVSHKLDEVEALCSRVTVLRQGIEVGTLSAPFSSEELVQMMFGQCLSSYPRAEVPLGEVQLALEDVSVHTYRLAMEHISLQVRAGEVVGLAGLEGSGQDLLMRACAGLLRIRSGRLIVGGVDLTHQPYRRFLEQGVTFLPAARLEEGMIGSLMIRDHVMLTDRSDGLIIDWQKAERRASDLISEYNIIGNPGTPVALLSGGNQQRMILSLVPDDARVLIMEHPTRGLDMESTRWVWHRLLQRRKQGTAVLFTSTDLDELKENSNRIVVFSGGVMSESVAAAEVTCDELGYLIGGRRR